MHLGMIRIDETQATIVAIPPTATKMVSATGESAKKPAKVKLPKLVSQTFSGEPHTSQGTWDVVERDIHKTRRRNRLTSSII